VEREQQAINMNFDNIIAAVKGAQSEANGSGAVYRVVYEFGKLKVIKQSLLRQHPHAQTLEICHPVRELGAFATSRRDSYQCREVA